MMILLLSLLLLQAPPSSTDILVVTLPAKGSVAAAMTPAGKLEIDRDGTSAEVRLEIDRVPPPQTVAPGMNTYVVWAVSPEGSVDNIGEMVLNNGKARFAGVSRFDQLGILVTAEPHYMVDRPSAAVSYRNQPPKEDARRVPVALPIGTYDYSRLTAAAAGTGSVIAQARAAFQIAASADAALLAESEFRLARVALDTMEELVRRASLPEIIAPAANESVRRSFRAFAASRNNALIAAMQNAESAAASARQTVDERDKRVQQLMTELAAVNIRVLSLQAAVESGTREREQALNEAEANRQQLTRLTSAVAVSLPEEFFDYATDGLTPGGSEVMTRIASVASWWNSPLRLGAPEKAVDMVKRFFDGQGLPPGRIVVVPLR